MDNNLNMIESDISLKSQPVNGTNKLQSNTVKKGKLLPLAIAILIIILLLIILAMGYLLIKTNKDDKKTDDEIDITSTPIPTPLAVEVTDTPIPTAILTPTLSPTTGWSDVDRPKWGFKMPSGYGWGECTNVDLVRLGPINTPFHNNTSFLCGDDYWAPIAMELTAEVIPTPVSSVSSSISEQRNIQVDGFDALYYKETNLLEGIITPGDYWYEVIVPSKRIRITSGINPNMTIKNYFDLFYTTVDIK